MTTTVRFGAASAAARACGAEARSLVWEPQIRIGALFVYISIIVSSALRCFPCPCPLSFSKRNPPTDPTLAALPCATHA
jgi:hypothetical protein